MFNSNFLQQSAHKLTSSPGQHTIVAMDQSPLFYQLFELESSTYTYLLADQATKEAILIDPVLETAERDLKLISELGWRLLYILETHVHADHITGAHVIREKTKAQVGVSQHAGVSCADLHLKDGQTLQFGRHQIKIFETPGHTNSCLTYLIENMLFTGDTLLIRGNGRTDFQQGSAETLYNSIQRLFALPQDYVVYPAHDYKGQTKTTLALEKQFNPRIGGGKTKEEFIQIMNNLKLSQPKKINEAVPANLACGRMT